MPPREPFFGSVTAMTMMKSALRAPLMKIFWPLITHLPFLYSARVCMLAGSEPAAGLGDRDRALLLSARVRHQVLLDLIAFARLLEHPQVRAVGRQDERHDAVLELLDDDGLREHAQVLAAVLFRHVDAVEPDLLRLAL